MTYGSARVIRSTIALMVGLTFSFLLLTAQESKTQSTNLNTVPRVVNFSGKALDGQGKPVTGMPGITFAIYQDQSEGAPLWMETQNVIADAKGNYTVQLGASKSEGLPLDLFSSGQARWLGVRMNGGSEQPRVLLLSVPYALKAADAQTLGGLPPSAFLLAPVTSTNGGTTATEAATGAAPPTGTKPVTTAGGTAQALAKFDANADVANSQVFDNGKNVGIGNNAPQAKLDVKGAGIFHGALNLPAKATATAAAGRSSQPLNLATSVFDSGHNAAATETFGWQAEPVRSNTPEPSGRLSLLFGGGGSVPSDTGLSIADNGIISFVPGQSFPGTTNGTVTSVGLSAPNSDFTVGPPVTSSGTLNLQWLVPPTSSDVANAIVKRDASGGIDVSNLDVEGQLNGFNSIVGSTPNSGRGVAAVIGDNFSLGAVEGDGVVGDSQSSFGAGVFGTNLVSGLGVMGLATGNQGQGVWGESLGIQFGDNNFGPDGVDGISHSTVGSGVAAVNSAAGDALFAQSNGGFAGNFFGDVAVHGNLSKSGGSFKIDHPLDPANKYLSHSFVESPDMMNVYNGNVKLDANGEAVVQLAEWFETLNRDFRYQLTCLDGFAPIYIAARVKGNSFKIAGGKPGMEVSWQVTGIRQDAWANAHRIPVEEAKTDKERGLYLHPELFGAPAEKSIAAARHPGIAKMMKESKTRQTDPGKQ